MELVRVKSGPFRKRLALAERRNSSWVMTFGGSGVRVVVPARRVKVMRVQKAA